MANYKRIANGNISTLAEWEVRNGSSWVAASVLPSVGDVVYANGFNSVIDQSWTVAETRNNVFQGTTGSGRFEVLTAGITFDGTGYSNHIEGVLYASFTGGTSTILGRRYTIGTNATTLVIQGQVGGILNLEWSGRAEGNTTRRGTRFDGNGNGFIVNVVTIEGSERTAAFGIELNGNDYEVNHTGTMTDGFIPIRISGSSNIFRSTGIISGPDQAYGNTSAGVYDYGLLNEIIIEGVAEATAFGPAVVQVRGGYGVAIPDYNLNSTSWITLGDGCTLTSTDQHPAIMGRVRVDDGAGVQWLTKSPTTADVYLYTASELTGYPLESKVEDGTVYGPSSEFEGTLEPWDATFAQALATAQRDLQLPAILSAITQP